MDQKLELDPLKGGFSAELDTIASRHRYPERFHMNSASKALGSDTTCRAKPPEHPKKKELPREMAGTHVGW